MLGVTVTVIAGGGGGLLLPPPQATMSPSSASETHRPATAEYFDTFRPTNPTITMPAIGNANGSHGERLSARCCNADPVPVFGPVVVMVE